MLQSIWKWLEHNRFLVIAPVVAISVWLAAYGCIPLVQSPTRPDQLVNAKELALDYERWQADQAIIAKQFELAGEDLAEQEAAYEELRQTLIGLASGGIPDGAGLVQLLLGGTAIGAITDNIRKRGLISGLKKNAKA